MSAEAADGDKPAAVSGQSDLVGRLNWNSQSGTPAKPEAKKGISAAGNGELHILPAVWGV